MLLGAVSWGRISDSHGRKFAFIGTLIMSGIFGILSSVSPNYAFFLVFRCLGAAGVGGNVPLGFTIFTEFSAKTNRGAYLTMLEAFWYRMQNFQWMLRLLSQRSTSVLQVIRCSHLVCTSMGHADFGGVELVHRGVLHARVAACLGSVLLSARYCSGVAWGAFGLG